MIIYSFDIGWNTGVCKLDTSTGGIDLHTFLPLELADYLRDYFEHPDIVIVEKMPKYNLDLYIKDIQRSVRKASMEKNVDIFEISPSTWKPIAKAQNWTCSFAESDHEYDAYCLCEYYRIFKLKDKYG